MSGHDTPGGEKAAQSVPGPLSGQVADSDTPHPSTSDSSEFGPSSDDQLTTALRVVLDFGTTDPGLADPIAWIPRFELADAKRLDAQGWILWCLVGLRLFGDRSSLPTARDCTREAAGMLAGLAMLRADGNITQAAATLETSRRALRERLRVCGMYPWGKQDPEPPA